MTNKRTAGQIVDVTLDAIKKGGSKIGSEVKSVSNKAKTFAGKHKIALIAGGAWSGGWCRRNVFGKST